MPIDADTALTDLERRRCEAIAALDLGALRAILSADYMHIHATGKIDDLDGFLDGIQRRPRVPRRESLEIRRYGDIALLVGEQSNTVEDRVSRLVTQQVAQRDGDDVWRFVSGMVVRKMD